MDACIGMLLFVNYWFWFPLIPCISMALTPCCVVGLNEDLTVVKDFQLQCNTKQSFFDYPAYIKKDEK